MNLPGSRLSMDELFHILNRRLHLSDGSDADRQHLFTASEKTNFQFESTDEELERCMISASRIHSAFKRHQNSFRTINKLPEKILAYIFQLTKPIPEPQATFPVRKDPVFYERPNRGFSMALGWIKVSWICQHWRKVALSSHTLWSDVLWKIMFYPHVACGPDHLEICNYRFKVKPNVETTDASIAFLQRSGDEPLQIKQVEEYKESKGIRGSIGKLGKWVCYALPPNPFYDALRLQTHRIQTWEIRTAYIVQENLWGLLTLPFPLISEFHLKVDSNVNTRKWEDKQANAQGSLTPTPRYSFPMLFGQREVPSLRKFSIWRYSRWPHNSFPNLTHLSLNEQYPDFRPSVDEFLDMLQSTPLLQYLHMDLAGPLVPRDFVPPPRTVELIHLKRIELHWWMVKNVQRQYPPLLMQCLQMPLDVEIMYLSPQVLDDEEDLVLDLPPRKYMENITDLKVLVNGADLFCLKGELLRIETSSFRWFSNYAPYVPNLETLLFLSDTGLNSRFPNFINLKHIHIAITDGLIYLMRAFAHPIPCCMNLEDLIVHGRADQTKDIEDATDMERQTIRTMLREGEVVVNRRLHKRSYRLISEKDYLAIYSFYINYHVGWRRKGPFKSQYKYDFRDESLYH